MLPGEWSEKFEFQNRPKDYKIRKGENEVVFKPSVVSVKWSTQKRLPESKKGVCCLNK